MADPRRFEVRDELGKGAFGSVYLAEMTSTSGFAKTVALKVLHAEWTQRADMTQRLRDEARLLGRLRHPHIVAVDDLVQVEGQWAVVMEYVPGDDLEALVHRLRGAGRFIPLAAVSGVAEAVARALHAAWSSPGRDGRPLRVVHRDIKPSNIRITPDGEVKVLDFGIAASTLDGSSGDVARAGSPAYMAPERLAGEVDGPAGDVYALGATLYELAVGQLFGRAPTDATDPEAVHAERVQSAAARIVADRGAGAERLASLIARCLAFRPNERPSAQEVADDARAIGRAAEDADLVVWARTTVEERTVAVSSRSLTMIESVRSGGSDTMLLDDLGGDAEEVILAETVDERGLAPTLVRDARVATPTGSASAGPTPPSPTPAPTAPRPARHVAGWLGAVLVGMVAVAWLVSRPTPTPPAVAPPARTETAAPQPTNVTPAGDRTPPVMAAPMARTDTVAGARSASPPRVPARPQGAATPTPATPTPAATTPTVGLPPSDAPQVPADAARLRAVKVTVPGATSTAFQCGDASGTGASSVNLRNVPAGRCSVRAVVEGRSVEGSFSVASPRGWTCVVGTGGLTCS